MATTRTAVRKRGLQGRYYVCPTGSIVAKTWALFRGKAKSVYALRKHTLKLMYHPGGNPDSKVMDLDWDWVDGTGIEGIGELRIHDTIGEHDNLRVIFFIAPRSLANEPLPRIWLMSLFQKKTKRFTPTELRIFKARKKLIIKRYYSEDG